MSKALQHPLSEALLSLLLLLLSRLLLSWLLLLLLLLCAVAARPQRELQQVTVFYDTPGAAGSTSLDVNGNLGVGHTLSGLYCQGCSCSSV
jgi:hypothetical protein